MINYYCFGYNTFIYKQAYHTTRFLGFCPARNQRQIPCIDPLLSCFFPRSLVFKDENHEIRDRLKVKTFFLEHFFLRNENRFSLIRKKTVGVRVSF